MPTKTILNCTVADVYLEILADRGIEYLFANAGTDFAPLIEALAKAQALGTPHPEPIICPHENTAQHMAIGYYLATGRPQMTMMHVNVGTANGMNGLLNASRGNIPMLFTAGRTPTNEHTLAGHRDNVIHWTQEMFDQGGGRVGVVEVGAGAVYAAGQGLPLFPIQPYYTTDLHAAYDVTPDDRRFVMIQTGPAASGGNALILVENFLEELKAKVGR